LTLFFATAFALVSFATLWSLYRDREYWRGKYEDAREGENRRFEAFRAQALEREAALTDRLLTAMHARPIAEAALQQPIRPQRVWTEEEKLTITDRIRERVEMAAFHKVPYSEEDARREVATSMGLDVSELSNI